MIAAILTGLFYALRNIVSKYVIANRMQAIEWYVYYVAIAIVVFPIISWSISPIIFPSMQSFLLIIVSATFGFVGALILAYGLSFGDVTTANPVLSMRLIFVVPLSYVFLGEFYGIQVVGWIMIILVGAILTSWSEGMKLSDVPKNKAFGYFLLTTFLFTFMSLTSKPVLQEIDHYNFIGWWNLVQIPMLMVSIPFLLKKTNRINLKRQWKPMLPYAILENIFLFASLVTIFFALKFSVSLTEALVATNGLFTVIIGFTLSKISSKIIAEQHTKRIYFFRIVGAALILFGVFNILT